MLSPQLHYISNLILRDRFEEKHHHERVNQPDLTTVVDPIAEPPYHRQ